MPSRSHPGLELIDTKSVKTWVIPTIIQAPHTWPMINPPSLLILKGCFKKYIYIFFNIIVCDLETFVKNGDNGLKNNLSDKIVRF